MKTILRIMILFICLLGIAACSNDDDIEYVEPTVTVSYKTIDGIWQLSEWNGEPLAEGQYCYLVIDRTEHTFTMYQNFDSQISREITGSFVLGKDEDNDDRDYISGEYDYNNGEWNDDYYITIYGGDNRRMVWIASETPDDVSVYIPCDEVPADILAGSRAL